MKICKKNILIHRRKGFLLLEVLLALTILSCGIIAVIKVYSIALRAQKHAQHQTFALVLASKLQEEIEAGIFVDLRGKEIKNFGLFEWDINVKPVYGEDSEIIETRVQWKERSREYKIVLSNLYPRGFLDEAISD